tara:strand:+ start:177 stop:464 length:288 start_codon:yes stop_codon:yes gene_type:complete
MLKNVEGNQPTTNDKPIIDTTWNLKWKTSTEDWLVELLSLIRKQKEPTQKQAYALRKCKEAWTNWNSDSQDWIKHGMTIVLPTNPDDLKENQDGN